VFSFPVIERELRVEARRPSNYWSRFIWGLAGVAALAVVVVALPEKIQTGSYLFSMVHLALAIMLLLVPPVATADTISRERREGTLGLLFLTPQTARQIVLGKLSVRLFRLFYFWLMFVPLLMLPMLTGGLQIQEVVLSIAILFSLLLSGTAVSLIASAISVQFAAAIFRALFFATLINLAIGALTANAPTFFFKTRQPFDEPWIIRIFILGPFFILLPGQLLQGLAWLFPSPNLAWSFLPGLIAFPLLLLCFSILYCTRRIKRYAEPNIETPRQAIIRQRFFTPVLWKKRFHASMRRRLQRNPFSWLEYRAPWSRAARLAALLALVIVETLLIYQNDGLDLFLAAQFFLLWILLLMIAVKSTTSFQLEKETGAFELILVTPITEKTLVTGRLFAVWNYYFPICLALIGFTVIAAHFGSSLRNYNSRSMFSDLNLCLSIFSLPATGLFFALRCRTYLPSLIWTAAFSIVLAPTVWSAWTNGIWYLANQLHWAIGYRLQEIIDSAWWLPLVIYPLYHCALILVSRARAVKLLERRSFTGQNIS
jgi:ABC-type transport system involved in multi-copper enzyme maturation permease subunit